MRLLARERSASGQAGTEHGAKSAEAQKLIGRVSWRRLHQVFLRHVMPSSICRSHHGAVPVAFLVLFRRGARFARGAAGEDAVPVDALDTGPSAISFAHTIGITRKIAHDKKLFPHLSPHRGTVLVEAGATAWPAGDIGSVIWPLASHWRA